MPIDNDDNDGDDDDGDEDGDDDDQAKNEFANMKQDGVNFLPLSPFQKPFPNTIIIFIVSIIGRQ